MAKWDRLRNHLQGPAFQDPLDPILFLGGANRTYCSYDRLLGGWRQVADVIAGLHRWKVTWFPDANVAIRSDTDVVWNALRLAALESSTAPTVITEVVQAELKDWMDEPRHSQERAKAIQSAMARESWIRSLKMARLEPIDLAIIDYAYLLGARRSLVQPIPGGTTPIGTKADDKSATMNTVKARFGERALELAKKGRKDVDNRGVIGIDDELNCLMVIAYALINGSDSYLLTADRDHLEVFHKAQWFCHTHYRAWLAAKMVSEGRYGEPAMELVDTDGFTDGPLTLYRRPTAQLEEVLPPILDRPICVGVLYVAPDGVIHVTASRFERRMLDMLVTRGATNGRCTDLFGEDNLHVDLGPLKQKLDGLYLGIGHDAIVEFPQPDGRVVTLSRLDLEHSAYCFERIGQ